MEKSGFKIIVSSDLISKAFYASLESDRGFELQESLCLSVAGALRGVSRKIIRELPMEDHFVLKALPWCDLLMSAWNNLPTLNSSKRYLQFEMLDLGNVAVFLGRDGNMHYPKNNRENIFEARLELGDEDDNPYKKIMDRCAAPEDDKREITTACFKRSYELLGNKIFDEGAILLNNLQ